MTLPLWAPFAGLAVVCAFRPPPRWIRSIDWVRVGAWTIILTYCGFVWFALGILIGRAA